MLSYTGDRAGDLGGLLVNQIYYLPDESGIAFSLTTGKTTSILDPRVVILFYSYKAEFCPVKLLINFLDFCKWNDMIKHNGYVFQTSIGNERLSEKHMSSSSANARLKLYLKRLNLWEGKTPHGTRSACAIMLSQLGVDKEAIKSHVGWKSDKMLEHYTAGLRMCNKRPSAGVLSSSNMLGSTDMIKTLDLCNDMNSLRKVYK